MARTGPQCCTDHRDITISHKALRKEELGPLCRPMLLVVREGSGLCAEGAYTMDSLEGSLAVCSCPLLPVPHSAKFPGLPQLFILEET